MKRRSSRKPGIRWCGVRALLIGCALAVACSSCSREEARVTDPVLPGRRADPEIFRNYSRTGDSKIAGGWQSGMDMSGVSFDQRQTATLISSRHVVMAKHYQRQIGAKVIFHDRNGKYLERVLVERKGAFGDVAVGLLNEPVPAGYRVYPLPAPTTDPESLVGRLVLVTDQNRRLFFHKVHRANRIGIALIHDKEDKHGWGKILVSGDSGNPSFLIVGRELVLVETHTSGGGGAGPYYGGAELQAKLREVMAEMDPSFTFRTVPVN